MVIIEFTNEFYQRSRLFSVNIYSLNSSEGIKSSEIPFVSLVGAVPKEQH
jgi:hypothetical protein